MGNALLEAALRYAAAGYRVVPVHIAKNGRCSCGDSGCESIGKHPRTQHGAHDSTTDEAVIRKWWARWPDANVGMTLEGLVAVDVDPRNGGDLDLLPGKLPDTCHQKTGGDGSHHVMVAAPGVKYDPHPAPGIDVKSGPGHMLLVEPSVHHSGKRYSWLDESEPWLMKPAPAPAWLAGVPGAQQREHRGNGEDKILKGGRDNFLTSLAGSMRRRGMSKVGLLAALLAENITRCDPPLPQADVERIAESVGRYEPEKGPTPPDATPFPCVWIDDAVLDLNQRSIVKGLIEPGAFVLVYGPSGSGKSFFTADLSQHIATELPWRGRRVQKSLVVYVASEAGASILKRFVAWREHRLPEQAPRVPLAILTRGPNLLADVDVLKLCDQLEALQQEAQLPLGFTVFDTLSRSIPGGDENKAEDMTMPIKAADIIRERFSSATGYVHHSGKDHAKGSRGHSSLVAAADVVLAIDERVATLEKVRDGVAGERFAFSLEQVELGRDPDGDPVMTCLLNAADDQPQPQKGRVPTGRNQKIVLPALRELALELDNRSPGSSVIPKGVLTVTMAEVIGRVAPKFGGDDPAYRVNEKIKDAIIGLQAAQFVGVHGNIVWLL